MIETRYKTLREVKAAIDRGELSEDIKVCLDNDNASIAISDPEDDHDVIWIWRVDDGYGAAEQALDALGIGHELA